MSPRLILQVLEVQDSYKLFLGGVLIDTIPRACIPPGVSLSLFVIDYLRDRLKSVE